ncbi:hypothetical protein [Bacillus sp. Marseille-P3661]|uniref:hypothetical protein n=1 Tax=Bacillus sp. Marseille-P3661 TaxID=1936234 RepID=UPI000C85ACF5|nr:hypothetical protein [Bacillus sp. Marseille-P3661]
MTKREIILSVAVGILIIFSIINYNKISDLQQRMYVLDNLQHEIQNVDFSVQDVSSQVHTKLDEFLQEQLWIPVKNYEITDIDLKQNTIDVSIQWSLRELGQQEKVMLLYREESEPNWSQLEVKNNNGLNYSIERTFPLQGNYETQIVAISEEGKRSEELLRLNFKEQLYSRMNIHAFLHPIGNGRFDMNIDIGNHIDQEFIFSENRKDLKIKTAKAFIYVDGKLTKEWDLLKENFNHHSDPYNEGISYHEMLNLGEDAGDNAELHVVVEDYLGLKYETKGNSFK